MWVIITFDIGGLSIVYQFMITYLLYIHLFFKKREKNIFMSVGPVVLYVVVICVYYQVDVPLKQYYYVFFSCVFRVTDDIFIRLLILHLPILLTLDEQLFYEIISYLSVLKSWLAKLYKYAPGLFYNMIKMSGGTGLTPKGIPEIT